MHASKLQDLVNTNIHDAQNIKYIYTYKISLTYGSLSDYGVKSFNKLQLCYYVHLILLP